MFSQDSMHGQDGAVRRIGERRSCPRHPWFQEVPLRPVGAGSEETRWASVQDVSDGGIGLLLRCPFRPGTVVTLELRGPGQLAPQTLVGRVIHATRQLHGNYVLGCALEEKMAAEELSAPFQEPRSS